MSSILAVLEFRSSTQHLKQLGLHYNVYNIIWDRSELRKVTFYFEWISRLADGQSRSHQEWDASLRARGKRTRSRPPPTTFPTRCFSTPRILSCSYKSWRFTAKTIWLTMDQRGLFLKVNILFFVLSLTASTPTLTSTAPHRIFSTPWTWQHRRKPLLRGSWCIMLWTTSSR